VIISFRFIEANINRLLSYFFLKSHVISWSERIDVDYTSMTENFVVYKWRKLGASKSKSYMTA